jgi:hypothetical protein
MKIAVSDASASLRAKDAELNELRSGFLKEIEATRNDYRLEIERAREIQQSELAELDREISDTLCESEERRKKLESDIDQLRLPVDHNPREPDQAPIPTPRRYRPVPPPQRDPMKAIREHFSDFQCQSGQKWAEFERYKSETALELKMLNATLKNALCELDVLKSDDSAEQTASREKALIEEIGTQKAVISQLRDESERLRVDVSKRKTLQAIQMQRIQGIAAIEASMVELEANTQCHIAEMSEKLREERLRNAARMRSESEKLEGALEQLKEVKRLGEDEQVARFVKWNELRASIGESTVSICNRYFSEVRSTSPNPRLAAFREPSLLPSLHHS